MRRIIIIATALVSLIAASVAYAALNTYTATFKFTGKAGTPSKPVPIGFTETLGAANATPGSRAAPLIDIKTTIYGLKSNAGLKQFATCTDTTKMVTQKTDSFCPKGALVAQGKVNALLGGTDLTKPGTACNPGLDVWNAGKNKLWFFFTTKSAADCGGLKTGDTAPYPGTIKQQGKNLVLDVPLPPPVSTQVAGQTGLYGSLIKQVLTWKNLTAKVKGKTVGINSSIGCKGNKRPWSVAFTAVSGSSKETNTVTGSSPCKK